MEVERIDHVAVLVNDMQKAERFLAELLETEFTLLGENRKPDIRNATDHTGTELVEPLSDDEVAEVLGRRGERLCFCH